jgi:hypothetical protein
MQKAAQTAAADAAAAAQKETEKNKPKAVRSETHEERGAHTSHVTRHTRHTLTPPYVTLTVPCVVTASLHVDRAV